MMMMMMMRMMVMMMMMIVCHFTYKIPEFRARRPKGYSDHTRSSILVTRIVFKKFVEHAQSDDGLPQTAWD